MAAIGAGTRPDPNVKVKHTKRKHDQNHTYNVGLHSFFRQTNRWNRPAISYRGSEPLRLTIDSIWLIDWLIDCFKQNRRQHRQRSWRFVCVSVAVSKWRAQRSKIENGKERTKVRIKTVQKYKETCFSLHCEHLRLINNRDRRHRTAKIWKEFKTKSKWIKEFSYKYNIYCNHIMFGPFFAKHYSTCSVRLTTEDTNERRMARTASYLKFLVQLAIHLLPMRQILDKRREIRYAMQNYISKMQ